ncbi:MAG: dienelactone hydrolase family protein [Sediminibacterium sp.]|nr:dienelactone hydrolase family protein [Sediminibacterium sp.]
MKKAVLILFLCYFIITSKAQIMEINYNDGDQKLIGYSVKSEHYKKSKPGVLIIPAWMGASDVEKNTAKKLAQLGYYTFVVDIYGTDKNPKNFQEAAKISSFYKDQIGNYIQRIKLGLEQLIKLGANEKELAVIGYCFGGTGSIEAALANLDIRAVVSFHGGLSSIKNRGITPINPKILVLSGADDPSISEADEENFKKLMRSSKADWQMILYGNAVHSFTNPAANAPGNAYNKEADTRSWNALIQFFDSIF